MIATANGRTSKNVKVDEVVAALRLFIPEGGVTEIRALDAKHRSNNWRAMTWSGYFDDPIKAAASLQELESASGVYFVFNSVDPSILARAANRLKEPAKNQSTSDEHIVRRRWFMIDLDANCISGISSTDAEIEASKQRALQVRDYLQSLGWPEPVLCFSGNGYHLYFRIDLPASDDDLIGRCLEALAGLFSDATTSIDTSVRNAARITKMFGTLVCKGDSTPDRPHRFAKIELVPDVIEVVPVEFLKELAGPVPEPTRQKPTGGDGESFDVEGFISRNGLDVTTPAPWKGGTIWNFNTSPMCEHHGDGPCLIQFPSGALFAKCHHNSCSWTWADLRNRFEPREDQSRPQPVTDSPQSRDSRESVGVSAPRNSPNKPFPVRTLPKAVAAFISAAAKAIGCDESFIGLPVLCCLARAVGNSRVIEVKPGWNEPAVLWGAIVAKSGSHITPAMQQATKFLEAIQAKKISEHISELGQYAVDKSIHEKHIAEWKRLKSHDPPPTEPQEPVCT